MLFTALTLNGIKCSKEWSNRATMDKLCDLLNGLPQVEWYVWQVEMSGNFLFVSIRSVHLQQNTALFIINAQGEFI